MKKLLLFTTMFLSFSEGQAALVPFTISQNTIWTDIAVTVQGCQTTQGDQSCFIHLTNNTEGGGTRTCDGNVYNNNYRYSCYAPASASQPRILYISVGTTVGACQITSGQNLVIRTLCNGVIMGAGDFCAVPYASTFTCVAA